MGPDRRGGWGGGLFVKAKERDSGEIRDLPAGIIMVLTPYVSDSSAFVPLL